MTTRYAPITKESELKKDYIKVKKKNDEKCKRPYLVCIILTFGTAYGAEAPRIERTASQS